MKFLTVLPRIRLLTASWTQLKPRRTLPATLLSVSEAAPLWTRLNLSLWRRPILETFGIIARKAPAEESCRRISLFLSYVFPPQPGTGSEADNSGMVTNPITHEKLGIGFQSLFPVLSVVDPELMRSVPPRLTAYQGLDTFFHLAEGYLSKKANYFNEMFSITGIEKIGAYLARAVIEGNDLEARENVAFANTLGGFVMSTGKLLSQHSLEHILSAYHPNLPHGAGLILISRAYFGFFIDKGLCRQKFIDMARALGNKNASEPQDFLSALDKLLEDCGVSNLTMSEFGIKAEELPAMAKEVRESLAPAFECDPTLLTIEDCAEIYRKSFK